ncbi:SIMPL domain-containing protein [Blastopirellula marina]|uniref:SIMPL domain-containing protein n=1 Tax=Blastopirellula marina TaxID=124 RepID=A0A2S8G9E9_9BACT|nr:SIMPL domain-containing protein [Blastopirellula marina]PQO41049.1 hypothetical protein C5Y98_03540 [Blastopirellula marina]PTL45925.1 DUF541 domain-containing protein [Blastopirellula marina]
MKFVIRFFFVLLAITASTIPCTEASAQEPPMVASQGEAIIQHWPTELVVRLDLVGRASSLDEALETLQKRKESAGLLLKTLGAEMDTVEYGDPTTANVASQGQAQMQAMIRQRIQRSGGKMPEGLKMPESTTVTLPMTARWKLDATDPTKLLQQVDSLRKQIEKADIGGMKSEEPTLAEQELLEEAESFGYDPYSDEPQAKPGTPMFSFAAKITEEERTQATKVAFQSAQADAKELAAAAGRELGELMSLSSSSRGGLSPEEMYGYGYGRRMPMPPSNDPLTTEVPELGKVAFRFNVQARFRLLSRDAK